jgi:signal transduction histidine kinase/Flp pilus assembly protein TadD
MKIKKHACCLIFAIIILMPALLHSQQNQIDSLTALIIKYKGEKKYEQDTNYINTVSELAFKYNNINPDTTILLAKEAVRLCDKINYSKGKVDALRCIGLAYNLKGDYYQSLALFAEALALANSTGYTKGAGRIYHNTGIVYSNLGKFPEALENYFKALTMREQLRDTLGISSSTNGIGAIYFVQGKLTDALNNYLKSLQFAKQINYLSGIETAYANIGEVYFKLGKYDEAKEYLLKALEANRTTNNKETGAFLSSILASVYLKQGKYEDAVTANQMSKKLAIEIGSQEYISRSFLGTGEVNLALKNYEKAFSLTQQGINIARQIGFIELVRDGNETLSKIYEAQGLGMQALHYYQQFKLYADSINNQQTEQKSANLAADYEYAKKEIVVKAEQEKKQIEFQKKTNQQRWIIFSAFAALFSALLVVWLIYRSRQKTKKANDMLQHQNIEIDKQKNIVEKALRDLKATQTQLIQSEKMASLGELTAGIAHEIQNPLNFVNNFSEVNKELLTEMNEEIAKGNYDEVKSIAKDITDNEEKINHHGKRADAIIKGMLQHSNSGSGKKEPTDVNALADEYLRLAYHGLRAKDNSFNATMKTDFDETIGNINIIPQDIGRVILNLITNAFYEVDKKKKSVDGEYNPTVSVSTKKENGNVMIQVKDNADGIPPKILDKIFQPFFTTKPTGQGTGLGLSLSYDIVKAHGGELKVETMEGEGSNFIIVLPFDRT